MSFFFSLPVLFSSKKKTPPCRVGERARLFPPVLEKKTHLSEIQRSERGRDGRREKKEKKRGRGLTTKRKNTHCDERLERKTGRHPRPSRSPARRLLPRSDCHSNRFCISHRHLWKRNRAIRILGFAPARGHEDVDVVNCGGGLVFALARALFPSLDRLRRGQSEFLFLG